MHTTSREPCELTLACIVLFAAASRTTRTLNSMTPTMMLAAPLRHAPRMEKAKIEISATLSCRMTRSLAGWSHERVELATGISREENMGIAMRISQRAVLHQTATK